MTATQTPTLPVKYATRIKTKGRNFVDTHGNSVDANDISPAGQIDIRHLPREEVRNYVTNKRGGSVHFEICYGGNWAVLYKPRF